MSQDQRAFCSQPACRHHHGPAEDWHQALPEWRNVRRHARETVRVRVCRLWSVRLCRLRLDSALLVRFARLFLIFPTCTEAHSFRDYPRSTRHSWEINTSHSEGLPRPRVQTFYAKVPWPQGKSLRSKRYIKHLVEMLEDCGPMPPIVFGDLWRWRSSLSHLAYNFISFTSLLDSFGRWDAEALASAFVFVDDRCVAVPELMYRGRLENPARFAC